jgi:hypothetical protein
MIYTQNNVIIASSFQLFYFRFFGVQPYKTTIFLIGSILNVILFRFDFGFDSIDSIVFVLIQLSI